MCSFLDNHLFYKEELISAIKTSVTERFTQYLYDAVDRSKEEKEIELIKIWSTVQGITSIVCMENIKTRMPWESYLDKLIY